MPATLPHLLLALLCAALLAEAQSPGAAPGPAPGPTCPNGTFTFSAAGLACDGLSSTKAGDPSAAACEATCCTVQSCDIWQWMPAVDASGQLAAGGAGGSCWTGSASCSASPAPDHAQWAGGARTEPHGGPPPQASSGVYLTVVVFLSACLAGSIAFAVTQKDRLQLDRLTHEMLVTSWLLTPRQLLAARCTIFCFMAATTLVVFSSGFGWTVFFFTNWGYLLLTAYFGSLVGYSLTTKRANGAAQAASAGTTR